jgi:acyl carrier protein
MGMDIVELVLRVEEVFDISIDDREAEAIVTVGLLYEYVLRKLEEKGRDVDRQKAWETLRETIINETGVRPDKVTKEARFIDDLGLD